MGKSTSFEEINKNYYRQTEDYDWITVTDRLVGLESLFHKVRQKSFLSLLREYLINTPAISILDAGCGTGLFSRHLPAGAQAVDLNPRHIAKAKKHAPHINFQVADLDRLPFPDNSFSLIICTEVIEHFPAPARALSELRRVLANGGSLLGTVPNKSLVWRLRFLSSTRPREPFHRYFNKTEINGLLAKFFKIKALKPANFRMNWQFVAKK